MIIKACKFRRTEESNWESGITFESNNPLSPILDIDGNIVPSPIYDITDMHYHLLIDVTSLLKIL